MGDGFPLWLGAGVAGLASGSALACGVKAMVASAAGEKRASSRLATWCFALLSVGVAGSAFALVAFGATRTVPSASAASGAELVAWGCALAAAGILGAFFPRAFGLPAAACALAALALVGSAAAAFKVAAPGEPVAVFVPHAVSPARTAGDFSVPIPDGVPILSTVDFASAQAALVADRLSLRGFFGACFGAERYRLRAYGDAATGALHRFASGPTPLDFALESGAPLPWIALSTVTSDAVVCEPFVPVSYRLEPTGGIRAEP